MVGVGDRGAGRGETNEARADQVTEVGTSSSQIVAESRRADGAGVRTILVVMGVSGSGKTTIAKALADRLGWAFEEGDDLHPGSDIAKMRSGHPLDDRDRWPWLERPDVRLLYLHGDVELIAARFTARKEHFMPASLLDSQLATLEEPDPDEQPIYADVGRPVDDIIAEIIRDLDLRLSENAPTPSGGIVAAISSDLPLAIEDYALIGDCTTAALVGRNGSIDWLCWPRFDSNACFAALLGTSEHGRWRISSADPAPRISRAYRDGTMVLETVFDTADGRVALIDFMPVDQAGSSIIRLVEGRRGKVAMQSHLTLRFDYGTTVPWVTQLEDKSGLSAIAGPSRVALRTPVALQGKNFATVAEFDVVEGQCVPFVLTHGPSHLPAPTAVDWQRALRDTEWFWRSWSGRCTYTGPWREPVQRSLLTLKALTYAETGGIVAAPTTSLPEQLGGERNWDYRYCWLRDATLTLMALMSAGYLEEAQAWRAWLQRSVAGSPSQIQIMYGLSGERQLIEWEVPWLPGYQGAVPVRIGNAAADQLQLDVYGELIDAIYQSRMHMLAPVGAAWAGNRS
jgi:gluconate kinase